jgi:hypothetical protein
MMRDTVTAFLRDRYLPTWTWLLMVAARHVGGLATRYPLADRADSLSCLPLFVVSAPRSGSTLLRSMLVSGGQVWEKSRQSAYRVAIGLAVEERCLARGTDGVFICCRDQGYGGSHALGTSHQ